MKSNFVYLRFNRPPLVFFVFFLVRKIHLPGSSSRPNVSEGYEVTSELPGRPAARPCNAINIISYKLFYELLAWIGPPPDGGSIIVCCVFIHESM